MATEIGYTPTFANGELVLDPYFVIPKGKKWRGQHVDLTLRIPEGKSVYFEDDVRYYIHHIDIDYDKGRPWLDEKQTWTMTKSGLICPAYREKHNYDRKLEYENFNNLIIG